MILQVVIGGYKLVEMAALKRIKITTETGSFGENQFSTTHCLCGKKSIGHYKLMPMHFLQVYDLPVLPGNWFHKDNAVVLIIIYWPRHCL